MLTLSTVHLFLASFGCFFCILMVCTSMFVFFYVYVCIYSLYAIVFQESVYCKHHMSWPVVLTKYFIDRTLKTGLGMNQWSWHSDQNIQKSRGHASTWLNPAARGKQTELWLEIAHDIRSSFFFTHHPMKSGCVCYTPLSSSPPPFCESVRFKEPVKMV